MKQNRSLLLLGAGAALCVYAWPDIDVKELSAAGYGVETIDGDPFSESCPAQTPETVWVAEAASGTPSLEADVANTGLGHQNVVFNSRNNTEGLRMKQLSGNFSSHIFPVSVHAKCPVFGFFDETSDFPDMVSYYQRWGYYDGDVKKENRAHLAYWDNYTGESQGAGNCERWIGPNWEGYYNPHIDGEHYGYHFAFHLCDQPSNSGSRAWDASYLRYSPPLGSDARAPKFRYAYPIRDDAALQGGASSTKREEFGDCVLTTGDFNGDGHLDIAAFARAGAKYRTVNNDTPSFTQFVPPVAATETDPENFPVYISDDPHDDHAPLAGAPNDVPAADRLKVRESRLFFGKGDGTFDTETSIIEVGAQIEGNRGSMKDGTWTSLLGGSYSNDDLFGLLFDSDAVKVVLWPGDNDPDILIGTKNVVTAPAAPNNGTIILLENDSNPPNTTFTPRVLWVNGVTPGTVPSEFTGAVFSDHVEDRLKPGAASEPVDYAGADWPTEENEIGIGALVYEDLTGDDIKDLAIADPASAQLIIYRGIATPPYIDFTMPYEQYSPGYLSTMVAADFTNTGVISVVGGTKTAGVNLGHCRKSYAEDLNDDGDCDDGGETSPCATVDGVDCQTEYGEPDPQWEMFFGANVIDQPRDRTGDAIFDNLGSDGIIDDADGADTDSVTTCWWHWPDNAGDPDNPVDLCDYSKGLRHGGWAYFLENAGGGNYPFSNAWNQEIIQLFEQPCSYTSCKSLDMNQSFVVNYDRDSEDTKDIALTGTDGHVIFFASNTSTPVFTNVCSGMGTGSFFVSSEFDLGPLSGDPILITGAKLTPFPMPDVPSGTSLNWFMRNDPGEPWQAASFCNVADASANPNDDKPRCTSFAGGGNQMQWGVVLCSDPTQSETPAVFGARVTVDYKEEDAELFGTGVPYNGTFISPAGIQPQEGGELYALSGDLQTKYDSLGVTLDALADGSRNIFTSCRATSGNPTCTTADLEPVTTANDGDQELQNAFGLDGDAASTNAAVVFVRGNLCRLGFSPATKLCTLAGSPAVLSKPIVEPYWWNQHKGNERTSYASFESAHSSRPDMIISGSRSGKIHMTWLEINAGTATLHASYEFIPPSVAGQLEAEHTSFDAAIAPDYHYLSNYSDGEITLGDFQREDGAWRTVAIATQGLGGRTVTALDVTDTLTAGGAPVGVGNADFAAMHLWTVSPATDQGNPANSPGKTRGKWAIARTKCSTGFNGTQWIAIGGSYPEDDNYTSPTAGVEVVAYPIDSSADSEPEEPSPIWRFDASPTTDISVVTLANDPAAFHLAADADYDSHVLFGDGRGRLFMLKLEEKCQAALAGTTNSFNWSTEATGMQPAEGGGCAPPAAGSYGGCATAYDGPMQAGVGREFTGAYDGYYGYPIYSLFDVTQAGTLPHEAPISSTLVSYRIGTTKSYVVVLTGGTRVFDPSKQNAAYIVDLADGSVLSKLNGACPAGGHCEKFSAAVATQTQLVLLRRIDPKVGAGTCDNGSSEITAHPLNDLNTEFFSILFNTSSVSGLTGRDGAIYGSTTQQVFAIGNVTANNAGESAHDNYTPPSVDPGTAHMLYSHQRMTNMCGAFDRC